ncbi:MAG: DUF1566 domain-containing protein [Gammaproteobacteria bacterium]|nr:DUF1566 domain-containing protein [Gammaproteobacteria bacterium]
MTHLNRNFFTFLNLIGLNLVPHYLIAADTAISAASLTSNQPELQRFIKVDAAGTPIDFSTANKSWRCVLDKKTGLLWEVKTSDEGLQDASQTYSWYVPHPQFNGGFPGYENEGRCALHQCNTQSYIDAINQMQLCGIARWRLPAREELRSIVDYQVKYPGPTVDKNYFPNTVSQFYWSSIPAANDKDSAWGIGFSFGYDYAYSKSNLGHVRLVSGP